MRYLHVHRDGNLFSTLQDRDHGVGEIRRALFDQGIQSLCNTVSRGPPVSTAITGHPFFAGFQWNDTKMLVGRCIQER